METRRSGLPLALMALMLAFLCPLAIQKGITAAAESSTWLDRDSVQLARSGQALVFQCAVNNPTSTNQEKLLDVSVANLDGNVLLNAARMMTLTPGRNQVSLTFPGDVSPEKTPECVVKWSFGPQGQAEKGTKSLIHSLAQLETRLVGYSELLAGSQASVRLVAMNHATGAPAQGADVAIKLAVGDKERELLKTKTGADGSLNAQFTVPEDVEGSAELHISLVTESLGGDQITRPVTVKRTSKVLLTTDKPLYQPGQKIQMRVLCLKASDLKPEANQAVVFEVMDSKGNKVFKKKTQTQDFGVASADFQLASEVNLGSYIVRAILGATTTEKQITIDKYVLPKFKVEVKPERAYYLPGETLKADVQADYFFGKPVAGGKVKVTASKFEIQFEKFAEVEGTLDEKGHWQFEIALPTYFAGTPIEQGKASVRLEAEVVDTAEHREEKVTMTPVAAAPLSIFAIPESPNLAPGLENRVYVLVSYPDGTPASGATVAADGPAIKRDKSEGQADTLGIATLTVVPDAKQGAAFVVRVSDAQGRNAEKRFGIPVKAAGDSLILRTDQTLCQVGSTLQAEVFTTKPKGTVYFDMVRQGQTVMTRTADLENGHAAITLDLDAGLSGSVVLQAYMFTPGTDLVRDTRLLYVNPADALNVGIEMDADVHKPGEPAKVHFRITDKAGNPTGAALGIAIVDESVFALQEIHPGLEKVYFTLEQEIMKPRYEIHGYSMDDLVKGPVPKDLTQPVGPVVWSQEQQKAACVLLASAPAVPEPPVRVNTFEEKSQKANEAIFKAYERDYKRVQSVVGQYLQRNNWNVPDDLLKVLLRQKYLRPDDLIDPWGNPYEFDFANMKEMGGYFMMRSNGPDGVKGTADDLSPDSAPFDQNGLVNRMVGFGGGGRMRGKGMRVGAELQMALPAPAAAPAVPMMAKGEPELMEKMADNKAEASDTMAVTAPTAQPRIREYFPETLLFEPALITDEQGLAVLDVNMADSITTWRMTAMASSRGGALGSREAPMRVFQDFFVDLDLPVALTQHDRVSIPVVVYNYLQTQQDVRLKFEVEPWFKLDGAAEQTLALGPQEVKSLYFPIEVVELGKHKLMVSAFGASLSDAIRREIEVLPDGEEKNVTFSDRLSGPVEHTITIPDQAVPGASKILVRVYPGVFSQIVDGLDSMLQMPSGCFEQTSAATYPNILIVQYMKATKQINPEIQMKAEGFINAGYQRLLAYEVQGGGFSWFGDAPANKILTAWGVKEFYDMSQVHEVDPAVIERTRQWLTGQQEPDGSWKPDAQYLHQESWGNIQKSSVLVTAYIADAILSTGDKSQPMQKAVEYLRTHWKECEGAAYPLSLVANAASSWSKDDGLTQDVLQKLYDMRQEDKDSAYWKGGADTVTFTHGDAADVETTALAAMAFMKAGKYPEVTTKALTYLVRKKSAQGHWGSTQATILALKSLMMATANQTQETNAKVTVTLNGEAAGDFQITTEDSDVMRLVDLGEKTKPGSNVVKLGFEGQGSMLYQVVGRYYMPWSMREKPQEPMTISVTYDKTQLAVNDRVTASVKVTNNRNKAAQMIIVDLGLPPGFQAATPDLDALVQKKVVQKYEMTGRQIILYFEKIEANATIEFSYTLQAKFPLKAQTPQSRVYEYYNPEVDGLAKPQELEVS